MDDATKFDAVFALWELIHTYQDEGWVVTQETGLPGKHVIADIDFSNVHIVLSRGTKPSLVDRLRGQTETIILTVDRHGDVRLTRGCASTTP